jgi:hypothetical protein
MDISIECSGTFLAWEGLLSTQFVGRVTTSATLSTRVCFGSSVHHSPGVERTSLHQSLGKLEKLRVSKGSLSPNSTSEADFTSISPAAQR